MKLYLAYGSNINKEQMKYLCTTAEALGTTVLKDHELVFKGSKINAYLTVDPKVGEDVPVVIWKINETHEKSLDRFEGYPDLYTKKIVKVMFEGKELEAMVYVMARDYPRHKPRRDYLNRVVEGYKSFGLDPSYVLSKTQEKNMNLSVKDILIVDKTTDQEGINEFRDIVENLIEVGGYFEASDIISIELHDWYMKINAKEENDRIDTGKYYVMYDRDVKAFRLYDYEESLEY